MQSISGLLMAGQMPKTIDGKAYYYFEHRTTGRNDVKLLKLDEYLGENIGYAFYFKALEVITELESPYMEKGKLMFAKAMGITLADYDRFIDCAISSGLFDVADDGSVFSPAYLKWMAKKQHAKDAGSKGGKTTADNKAKAQAECQANSEAKPKPKRSPVPFPRSIISEIVDYWNATATAMKCNKITKDVTVAIAKREEYGLDEIKATICNYHKVLQDKECFFNYAWNIVDFFNRKNGFPSFVGGDEIVKRYKTTNDDEQIAKEQDSVKRHF